MKIQPATRPVRVVLVLALALLATIGLAGPASAHATLIGSDPADGATVQTAPTAVTLTFDDSLENFEPVVTVTGPDGNQYQSGPATIDGAKLSNALAPLTVPGTYAIAYRVVSDDGHPVEGQLHFELAVPAAIETPGSAAASASSSAAPSVTPATSPAVSATAPPSAGPATTSTTPAAASTSSSSAWGWLIIAALILIASAASIVVRRRMAAGGNARSKDE